jgi:MOSC domain-containing protein YiiM
MQMPHGLMQGASVCAIRHGGRLHSIQGMDTRPPEIHIAQLCAGRVRTPLINGRKVATAIAKSPLQGRVALGRLGLEGDEQADLARHGGIAKALYAYPQAHDGFWRTVRAQARVADWGEPLPPGLFGENLLLAGVREHELWIGDRLRGPDAVLAVSEPRMPCFKFDAAMGFKQASKLMAESGFCGSYLAVIETGTLAAGDTLVLEPGPREVNLRELFRARMGRG